MFPLSHPGRNRCHNRIIPTVLTSLLARGRRRILTQLGWTHLITALGVAFGASILLLLLGTQILDWYWLPAVFLAGIGFGVWRMMQAAPSTYVVAQRIDHALSLHDSLSTAFHFGTSSDPASASVKEMQAKYAEELAHTVDLKSALPFQLPKSAYISGALALVALTMFGVRYGVTQSLDFKPSLVAMAFDNFFSGSDVEKKKELAQAQRQKNLNDEFEKMGIHVNTADQKMNDLDPGNEHSTDIVDTPDVNPDPGNDAKNQAKTTPESMKSEGAEEGNDKEGADTGKDSKGKDSEPEAGDGKSDQSKEAPDKQGQQKGDNSSLMDKLKDAMQNMMNKMKQQQKGDQKQQQQQNASKDGASQQQQGQKGEQQGQKDQQGQQQQGGDGKEQKAEGKDGQQGQKSENAQGKASDQKGNQQPSPDSKSGQGKQDGLKDLRDAELQQAMGKLSEIYGKRQQNLSGEITIEVSSGKQQLKTAYTSKSATHKEAGGEINRDEVPLIYQQYVEKYFDQIRKADAAAEQRANPAATKPPATGTAPARPTSGASQ